MISRQVGGKTYNFGDTLRVAYELRKPLGVNTLQEVLTSLQQLDFEKQIALLYTAYRVVTLDAMSEQQFTDALLDSVGITVIAKLAGEIVDGLVYTGVTKEERQALDSEASKNAKTPKT